MTIDPPINTPDGPRPTVVLVHGAFADSSSWNGVIATLSAPATPSSPRPTRCAACQPTPHTSTALLDSVSGPVVLVGHSYGGSVISQAADRPAPKSKPSSTSRPSSPRRARAPPLATKFPGTKLGPALNPCPSAPPGGRTAAELYIKPDQVRRPVRRRRPAAVAALMAATQRPVAAVALADQGNQGRLEDHPLLEPGRHQGPGHPRRAKRFMGGRAGSHTVEVKASHAVSVSRRNACSPRPIEQAAQATA